MVDAEFVGTDSHRRFTAAAPHHKPGGLQVDRAISFLPDRPINPQLDVRTHRQGVAALERYSVLAHVAGDAVTPAVLNALFRLPVAKCEMHPEPCASTPVFCSSQHLTVVLSRS